MKCHLKWFILILALLTPVFTLSPAGWAKEYLTKEQALKVAFPEADTVSTNTVALTKDEQKKVADLAGNKTIKPEFTYYTGTRKDAVQGFAVMAEAMGKTHPFNFLLVTQPNGTVSMVEITMYAEARGGEVRQKSFLNQFKDKSSESKLRVGEDIKHVAGATISCRGLTEAIRLQLAYLTVLAPLVKTKAAPEAKTTEAVPATSVTNLEQYTRAQYLMGTLLELLVYAPDRATADRVMARAFTEVARLETLLSTYQKESDVSRLNRAPAHQPVTVAPEMIALLQRSRELTALTTGAFDVTIGPLVTVWQQAAAADKLPTTAALAAAQSRVGIAHLSIAPEGRTVSPLLDGIYTNFGGIGKGYALDRAAEVLQAQGITAALLNFGGQVLVVGFPPKQSFWTVEVRDPHDPWTEEKRLTEVRLTAGSISTSADYARGLTIQGRPYSHIIDPRTGQPVDGMLSVTVIASTATDADALSTGLYVLGMRDGQGLIEKQQLAVMMVDSRGAVVKSPAFREREHLMTASGR
ncbi:MAG: FAD:protein FMN transferase [Armatimonadota bacterium]